MRGLSRERGREAKRSTPTPAARRRLAGASCAPRKCEQIFLARPDDDPPATTSLAGTLVTCVRTNSSRTRRLKFTSARASRPDHGVDEAGRPRRGGARREGVDVRSHPDRSSRRGLVAVAAVDDVAAQASMGSDRAVVVFEARERGVRVRRPRAEDVGGRTPGGHRARRRPARISHREPARN